MEDVSGVLVVSAERFADAANVAEAIRTAQPTAVDLRRVHDDSLTRRFVDFLAGAMAVAGGKLERFADRVYLAHPDAVEVTQGQRDALADYLS